MFRLVVLLFFAIPNLIIDVIPNSPPQGEGGDLTSVRTTTVVIRI
jgi:hypothetical protein